MFLYGIGVASLVLAVSFIGSKVVMDGIFSCVVIQTHKSTTQYNDTQP